MAGSVNKNGSVRPTVSATNQLKPFNEGTRSLQIEINKAIDSGLIPGPRLREDGIEGPKTRAKLQEYMDLKPETPATQSDRRDAKDPTVGEYVEGQIREFGKELQEDAKLSAIMLTPGLNVVAGVIMTRHMNQARERIAKLPMDPEGNWKHEAAKILNEERQGARKEILALPGKVVDGVADGAVAIKDGVVDAAQALGDGVTNAAGAIKEGVGDAVEAVGNAADAFGDKISEMAHDLKDDAQVIAVTAIAPIPVAIIEGKHVEQARERIAALPMDPEGKWKQEAGKILAQEQAEAKAEILALPGKVVDGVVDFAGDVKDGVVDAAQSVGNTVVKGYKIAEFAVEEAVDDVKDFGHDVAEGISKGVKETRQDVGGFFQRLGKWISGD